MGPWGPGKGGGGGGITCTIEGHDRLISKYSYNTMQLQWSQLQRIHLPRLRVHIQICYKLECIRYTK